jgi:Mor family transcriptional regulator
MTTHPRRHHPDRRLPESAEWLAEQIQHSLADELHTPDELLAPLSQAIVRRLMVECGGASVYLPARCRPSAQEIRASCDGRPIAEVARALGVSRTTVYRVLAAGPEIRS